MPRDCPVESHGGRYQRAGQDRKRCHGLVPWSLTVAATNEQAKIVKRCHGLVPWSLTVAATNEQAKIVKRCHGLVPWSLTVVATACHYLSSSLKTCEFA